MFHEDTIWEKKGKIILRAKETYVKGGRRIGRSYQPLEEKGAESRRVGKDTKVMKTMKKLSLKEATQRKNEKRDEEHKNRNKIGW